MQSNASRLVFSSLVAFTFALALACGSQPEHDGQGASTEQAAKSGIPGKPPDVGPPTGDEAGNNVSFPVIFSDGVAPSDEFPTDKAWTFAAVTDPLSQCILGGPDTVTIIDPAKACYYGPHITVVSETGELVFDPPTKVWWLQKRTANFWKAFTFSYPTTTPFVVSAVDVGDLLESSPSVAARQIRTEFNLLQNVDPSDPVLGAYVVTDWSDPQCEIPSEGNGYSVGCFAALGMSGALPGTEQSGAELQGTDFGPGSGTYPGTGTFLDPTQVRSGFHAIVYSRCARLLIQEYAGEASALAWDPATGRWKAGDAALPAAVNAAAYGGGLTAEVTSSGGIVYGYNWNATPSGPGSYRLTFVLDGNDEVGPRCGVLNTRFASGTTELVNQGENNLSHLVHAGASALNGGDEGGLVYIDLTLTEKGGGGKNR